MKKTISLILVLTLGLAAEVANADFTFGEPTNLGPTVNSSHGEIPNCFSADGLEFYFHSYNRPGGYGHWDIWIARRPTIDDDWGAPENLGPPVNTSQFDGCAFISFDGLELYFNSGRPGGYGSYDIWVSTRQTKDAEWGTPVNLGPIVNSSSLDGGPLISTDDLSLYFSSKRPGGYGSWDIWVATRETVEATWREPVNLGAVVNSSAEECGSFISANGLSLFFCEEYKGPFRPGGFGKTDMWVTTRASVNDPWGTPVNLGPIVNSPSLDFLPRISPDGSMLYFSSERPGGLGGPFGDIYQAPIIPIVDFNGDGIVDCADMCIMVDHWGENYPLCDIGPTPFGDGIVDVQDLIVLAEYLLTYPGAVAYWKLDEMEGNIAYDSVAVNDAVVFGDAVWQPTGGKVAGALQFDGIDDYVSTPFILDPADAVFSVFAWVKGAALGQVIISQTGGANWLLADPTEGNLMTELEGLGRGGNVPIVSETVITDGNWHRIGLVWDGSNRTLYVDDVEVARDTQARLAGPDWGLYFGAGSTLEPASFWSGLIDDVRIYNRAVTP